jgi:hypothetical protein
VGRLGLGRLKRRGSIWQFGIDVQDPIGGRELKRNESGEEPVRDIVLASED